MPKATLYWKSTCTSCRDARSALRDKGVAVDEINYAKSGLDEATVRAIVTAVGSVAAVLNTRHAIAKEQGWGEMPPSVDEFCRAASEEVNLLRRPILLRGKTILVGFDKSNRDRWAALD
ncbi:MAG: hypothetical protein HOW73_05260 [Polyangiaceae bacterium]|nr:hypothetical protein [Polyangiaceae bacterium]